jgi:DNA-binding NarL/FixJ family response regulator
MAKETTRVLLADDHVMVREALSHLLHETHGLDVVGQVGDGNEAVRLARSLRPDVIVLDYSMPGTDTPAVVKKLRGELPDSKVLILTVHENVHYAVRSLGSGAHGYVIKAAATRELAKAIQTVRAGKTYVSPGIAEQVQEYMERPKKPMGLEALTEREFGLLRGLVSGKSLKQCARDAGIGVTTAATYRARLMKKLHLDSTAAIIRFALENGITG